jgi:predicted RND superfamily exporter protein
MATLSSGIIRHRKLVLILFITIAVICAVLQLGVSVNYNMTDYLPENAQSTQALSIIENEFTDAVPNARVMLYGVSVLEAVEYKQRLASIDGVSDVLWLDDVVDLKKPLETADVKTVDNYYKDGNALISLTIREGDEVRVTGEIYSVIGENNALSGNAINIADAQKLTGSETQTAMLILVPVIILILLLTTNSWLEPILYLLSIGISVLINMGTNLIFGEISFMTNAISPILQLAVSLDYAIFLLHSFEDFRKQTDDIHEAMRLAMKRAFSSVAASAATTFFGFLALVFMKFGIGSDLGIVLIKGIVLSFLSVMVFLPALALCSYKLVDRTKHRRLFPEFKGIGKLVSKVRIPALILVVLLIVPAYLAQSNNDFSYGTSKLSETNRSGIDTAEINREFGQSTVVVLLVPRGDIAKEQLLSQELETFDHVTEVISYATTVGTKIPDAFLDDSVTNRFYSDNYSRIVVYTDTADEGETAFSVVEQLQSAARSYYGDTVFSTGQSVTLYDMKNVVTADNQNVNLIAIISILLVLLITFRSASLPLILLVTIETAIWLNLSAPYFSGNNLIYIGYLILNTVQLGATVDYAILMTNHYLRNRQLQPKKDAMKTALGEVFGSILTSAAILALAGFALKWTSTNPIVSEMGLLLGRGTIMSFLMVILFLPAALTLFDKLIQKTTIRSGFHKE